MYMLNIFKKNFVCGNILKYLSIIKLYNYKLNVNLLTFNSLDLGQIRQTDILSFYCSIKPSQD